MSAASVATELIAYNLNLETSNLLFRLNRPPPEETGRSVLHELAREGDVLGAEIIFEAGGNIDLPDDEGKRPLHEAAFFNRQDMAEFLLSNGAVLDAPIHPLGHTALYLAVQAGRTEMARFLIEKGARMNVEDALTGKGPLHLAAARGDMALCGVLIAGGVNVFQEDKKGRTARDHAARNNHKALEAVLLKVMTHHARFGA